MNIQDIFQSQKEFFKTQQTKALAFREQNLQQLKHLIKANETLLFEAIYKDFRKSSFDTHLNELSLVYKEIDFFLKNLRKLSRPTTVKTPFILQPGSSRIYHDPLGVTLVIGAWNYPYSLTLIPMVAAIAAGNTCIIKPSELPHNTMNTLAKLINDHFPAHFLHVEKGGISETTELLKLKFDKIFFTGSPKVGKIVYEAAAKNLVPVVLELGGKSPAIVTKTANLEVAAKRLVWGKFINAGQTCIAPDYLLVEETVKPQLLQLIKKQLLEFNYSDGAEHYTAIINQRNFDRILGLVDRDKIFFGGNSNASTLYIEPTILDDVYWEDAIMQEEIFGPLLPVLGFSDLTDVLQKISEGEKPLSAYLFSQDEQEKSQFLNRISFGGGCINDTLVHFANDHLPFGGVGNSGIGHYHGAFGFHTFSHQKAVVEKKNWGEPPLKYPPYSENKLKWIKRFL